MLNCLYTTIYCCLRAATRAVLLDTTSKLLTSAKGREHVRKYLIQDKGFLEGNPASRNHCILLKYSAAVQQLSCILHHSLLSHNLQVGWGVALPSSHGRWVCFNPKPCAPRPQAKLHLLDRLHQLLRNTAHIHVNEQRSTPDGAAVSSGLRVRF